MAEQKNGVQFSPCRNKHKKHRIKSWLAAAAAVLLVVAALVIAGIQYSKFVTQTIYEESTAHLVEVLHQSNKMLNETVNKNMTYLHIWSSSLQHLSDEREIRKFIETARQETGFTEFYFLSPEGNYMTVSGETGYLGLQGDLEENISQGNDIVMSAVLPGKPQMLVFACPEIRGSYQGFAYNAIAVAYNNEAIVQVLDISAFQGSAICYVVHSDGRIVINGKADPEYTIYNLFAVLQEYFDLTQAETRALARDFEQGNSGSTRVTLDGVNYYLTYVSVNVQDWMLVSLVPADIVNAGMNTLQSRTVLIVTAFALCLAVLAILLILQKSRVKLRRKNTELLYREELFAKLSLNVDDVFMMVDAKTARVDYVSPNIERLLGIPGQKVRQDIEVLKNLHQKDAPDREIDFLAGLISGQQREWNFDFIHQQTGEHRWFHNIAMGSEVEGRRKYILVMSDRTADKKVNQALSKAVHAAETANRAKSTFLSNMSHDIRTPMNAIIGFTTLAVSNVDNKEKVRDYLGKILASSNHLLSLINDVLDMSRIESGKIHLDETEVNLSDVLHDLKTIVSGQIHAKQLELYMDAMDVTDEDVYCDKTRLNQVLLNLLSNAIKFTPAGGTVSVRLKQLTSKKRGCGQYEIRVKDNGIGMSPEFVKKIFEPFERERTSTVSKTQGTGLGMAITKNIVDLMGGSINVESTTGKGTRFEVVLEFPVDAEADTVPEAQVLPEEEEETSPLSGMKFLCAEDNAINAEILEMLLEANGASCTICSNGQEIVDAFASVKPGEYDMILMDVQMPVMDGLEATRRIRSGENPLGRIIPILAMTANAFLEDMQKSREAGMDEHLSKPVDIAALERTVKRFRVIPPKINSGQARFRRGSTQTM